MTLDQLIARLTEIAADGYGDRDVIADNTGQPITQVAAPTDLNPDETSDPCPRAVLLHCTPAQKLTCGATNPKTGAACELGPHPGSAEHYGPTLEGRWRTWKHPSAT
jgi:hypothetical protein